MKYFLSLIALITISSCSVPFSFGVDANGIRTSYSSKGGLQIDIRPEILIDQSSK